MKFCLACPDGNKIYFSSSTLFFCKQEIDFSQTNNLDIYSIYIAVMELEYQESQYLSHQMFNRLSRLHFFICYLNISDFVLQITRSKVLIKTSVCTETLIKFGAYMRSPFASVLAFTNFLDPGFYIILPHNLYN